MLTSTRLLTTLAITTSLLGLLLLTGTTPAATTAAPDPSIVPITATGTGSVSSPPDTAVINLGATVTDANSAKAQDNLNMIIDATIKAVRATNIPGLTVQTQWVSVQPQFDFNRPTSTGQPSIIGYIASNTISITLSDPKQTGRVIDAAIAAGGNQLQGVTFQLINDAAAKGQALTQATLDARTKADAIAAALGLRITRVIEASTGAVQRPWPSPNLPRAMMTDASAFRSTPTPIESGTLETTAEATVVFAAVAK